MDLIQRRRVMLSAGKQGIPMDGLVFGLQPNQAWNLLKPNTVKDLTGKDIAVYGVWGTDIQVNSDNMIETTVAYPLISQFTKVTLADGFAETAWVQIPPTTTARYFTNFQPSQLSFIYGYATGKLEFYNYPNVAGEPPMELFRRETATEMVDGKRHFVALSYNAATGQYIFRFDDIVRSGVKPRYVFSVVSARFAQNATNIGQTLFYSRPLSERELETIYQNNGVF